MVDPLLASLNRGNETAVMFPENIMPDRNAGLPNLDATEEPDSRRPHSLLRTHALLVEPHLDGTSVEVDVAIGPNRIEADNSDGFRLSSLSFHI